MEIDFSNEGKVINTMINYIEEILEELPDDMAVTAATPAACHLFEVDDNGVELDQQQSDFFHHKQCGKTTVSM
jgi:hypothetical protein